MRVRPLAVFLVLAALMASWLSVRMWEGDSVDVWRVSCLLGAWAPLGAATIALYVRAVGGREDGVLAAWLVRVIGMHCVLVWMLGFRDWMRGPPGTPSQWLTELDGPFGLLAFVPSFALSLAVLAWLRSVARRMDLAPPRTDGQVVPEGALSPYRRAARVGHAAAPPRPAVLPLLVGSLAGLAALAVPLSAAAVLVGTAVALALASAPGRRAVGPSVASLVGVAGLLLTRHVPEGTVAAVRQVVAWPWVALLGVGVYLGAVEARLRVRGPALR